MKAVAAVVMVVGLTLMSAPLVLPRLGITMLPASAAKVPADETSGLAAMGAMMAQRIGAMTGLLGGAGGDGPVAGMVTLPGPAGGTLAPGDMAAQFAAVCAELQKAGQMDSGACAAGGIDPAALAAGTAAAGATILDMGQPKPRRGEGAKFVKVGD